jgi:hypothetical protein
MTRPARLRRRTGYCLTVVLIFLLLMVALWSTVSRSTAGLLRLETSRVLQETRDQGAMNALAQAVQLLEYSTPSDPTNPDRTQFTYGVTVTVSTSGECTTSSFTVQFTPAPQLGTGCWQVQVTPGSDSVALPTPGANPQWP